MHDKNKITLYYTCMKWEDIKSSYKTKHIGRNPNTDHVRIRAWKRMEEMLMQHFTEVIADPIVILNTGRKEFKMQFAQLKPNKKLNGAETAIINYLFNTLLMH